MPNNLRPLTRFIVENNVREHFISIIQRAVHAGEISSDFGASIIMECHKNPKLREQIQNTGRII